MRTLTGDHGKSCTFIPAGDVARVSRVVCHLTPQSPSARTLFGSHAECLCGLHPQRAACSDQCTRVPNYRALGIKIIRSIMHQHFCSAHSLISALLSSPVTKSKSHTKRKSGLSSHLANAARMRRWTWTHADALGRVGRRKTPHNHNTYTPDALQSLQRTTLPTRLLASRASPLLTRAVRCEALAQLGDA